MACHIQGIRVAAPSSGQGTSRGTNYGLISSGHIFQIFQNTWQTVSTLLSCLQVFDGAPSGGPVNHFSPLRWLIIMLTQFSQNVCQSKTLLLTPCWGKILLFPGFRLKVSQSTLHIEYVSILPVLRAARDSGQAKTITTPSSVKLMGSPPPCFCCLGISSHHAPSRPVG